MSDPEMPGDRTRLATAADWAALCEMLASVTMKSGLHLSVERGPDFYALYRLQTDQWHAHILTIDGRIKVLRTGMARPGGPWMRRSRRWVTDASGTT